MIRKLTTSLLFFLLLVQPIHALEIIPEDPVIGDDVLIRGIASPGELVELTTVFEKRVPVVNGKYIHTFEGIRIPDKDNVFTVNSKSVKDLTVAVRLLIIWIPVRSDALNGIATVSQTNVPAGTYTIKIHGDAAPYETYVDLTITASTTVTADLNGNFEFSHSTAGIPLGTFDLRVGGVSRTVTLHGQTPIEQTSTTPIGGGGGGRVIRLDDTEQTDNEKELNEITPLEIEVLPESILFEDFVRISKIESAVPKFIKITDTNIIGIRITTIDDIENTSITIQQFEIAPKNISELHGVYNYFKINSEIQSENIENISIDFKVRRNWITDNNIDKNTIKLNRFDASLNEWSELQTKFIDENDLYLFYTAESSSFSIFAITGMEKETIQIIDDANLEEGQEIEKTNDEDETSIIPNFNIFFVTITFLMAWVLIIRNKKNK
ncbi:MAG: PGF-pre-PGF domain-containing protein [Methanosarcinaceae archaeon]|nr:PGF-pre-PGF domain-containing protein [Methanosarcinaceae archaeon]